MSLESPGLNHGSKRTASGIIKTADAVVHSPTATPSAPSAPSAHKRTKSTGSNTRIGELSAQLKTRLSYAMIKVQNGWEKQSLEELEDQTSQRGSPSSAPAATERLTFESPRPTMRRPSGVSDSDFPMMSPGQGSPSYLGLPHVAVTSGKRVASCLVAFVFLSNRILAAAWPAGTYAVSPLGKGNGPVLAPPAEIGPRRKRRSSASHAPPPLLGSGQRKHYSDLGSMSAPRTPTSTSTPRAGILRMPSQQAEKDAVDTLLFMSSPNNSGRIPHTSADAQPSPLRTEVSTRRVMFDHTAQERYMASQSQHMGPNGQPAPQ
ncbi:hypothetical protein BU24DRAFT_58046 [Aaosphaeria arxii CBS 175.79]|uniref:Cyclin-dependent kinase n=1 Tax=Aaosphaeria arxii CBS 175.79 TaxID=1450172 RepID=A0A6A5XC68_9PLEO|nr:uncharacterized protein BU24DRAFT_58046 [Aaosphaeria arxii CBS 175.79]KAF2010416.1 hypothetical protein BU24DRAFT_58046 [Aaosphaeria arxii CBS 175.79]